MAKIKTYYVYAGHYENYISGHKLPKPYVLRDTFDNFEDALNYVMDNWENDALFFTKDVADENKNHYVFTDYAFDNDDQWIVDMCKRPMKELKKSSRKSIKESNYDLINDDLLAMLKGSCKQLTYAISYYEGNYSDRSLKELQRKLEEVEDFCNEVLYQVNKRK